MEIIGKKVRMSQVYNEAGRAIPVTLVSILNWAPELQPDIAVAVTGRSKGKGFAGVIKRHGFHGGPATHGQSDRHRAPGSIGGTTTPGRVYKGKKMAGHMGGEKVTLKSLKIVEVNETEKIIKLSGPIPGPNKCLVRLTL